MNVTSAGSTLGPRHVEPRRLHALVSALRFYQASGLVQHHLTGHLDRRVAFEFSSVTLLGIIVVIAGRLLSFG